MSVNLDYGVRRVEWIKLVGYSVFDKRLVDDDWIALHIKGLSGGVVSNNAYAHGCFAILHIGGESKPTQRHKLSGAVEYHTHEPGGIFHLDLAKQHSPLRELRLQFVDRNGRPAHFGRVHLWFRVCVAHG